jgi:hypothetical protein
MVLMHKSGFDDIYALSTNVAAMEALGWKTTPSVRLDGDVLKIDEVAVKASAANLNALENLAVDAGSVETLQVRHYQIAPAAASATGVHAAANLAAAAQDVASAITNPDVPRNVTVKGNVSGITGNVVISGLNFRGDFITDTIALNGVSEVAGVKAFASVTNIHLPARVHTPVYQVETATVVGTITLAGDATVIVTAAGMTGSPKTKAVAVALSDDASAIATKIRAALNADTAVTALYTVGGSGADITLTRKTYAADDNTLNISLADGTCVGITTAGSSANTTAGVQVDTVSVGIGTKFGLPHIVAFASMLLVKLFGGSADTGTLAVDDDELEKNLFTINGTPDGSTELDLYYIA